MTINGDILHKLMQEVEQGVDKLLSLIDAQNRDIDSLKYQNEQLKHHYSKILGQIGRYIEELEDIKSAMHKK